MPSLKASGAQVARLTRGTAPAAANHNDHIPWEPDRPLSPQAISGFHAVIHLAGEGIVGRWTPAKKEKIRQSRILGTQNLAQALAHADEKPAVFVCGSAIGYYGDRNDEVLREESAPGSGFLAEVCQEWEEATRAAAEAGIRTVQIRTGIVLSPSGGALGKMLPPFKLGLGGRIGDGHQWMSWIDIQDMVGAIHHILNSDLLRGPVNLVAPRPVTNTEFTRTLGRVLSRPTIFPVPKTAVRLAFGEMGQEVLLGSQRVEPTKLIMSGYPFRYQDLEASLRHLLQG